MAVYKHIIANPEHFSFPVNLRYLQKSEDGLYRASKTNVSRFILIEKDYYFISVYEENENELALEIEDTSKNYNREIEKKITSHVINWLDLEVNLDPFYNMAKSDPILKKAVSKFYGLRNIAILDLFETFVWAILGQQINLQYAYTLKERFIRRYGQKIEHKGVEYWLFPSAKDIASRNIEELFQLGVSKRKCEYIHNIAGLIADNHLTKEKLLRKPNLDSAIEELTNIRGVGPWTANYVLMRCLRFRNAFPINDVVLHNAIKLAGSLKQKPSLEEIKLLALPWAGNEAYATFYLWRLIY